MFGDKRLDVDGGGWGIIRLNGGAGTEERKRETTGRGRGRTQQSE
mgnify:CR=1 FL=1